MESTVEDDFRPMPMWMSVPLLLICLVGGVWILKWYMWTDSMSPQVTLLPAPTVAVPQPTPGRPRNPNGGNQRPQPIRETRTGRFLVKSAKATLNADFNQAKPTVSMQYQSYDFAPEAKLIRATGSLAYSKDQARFTAMKLLPTQVSRLQQLASFPNIPLTSAKKDELIAALNVYKTSPDAGKAATEAALLKLMDEVAAESVPATKQAVTERAKQINDAITPEQWKIDVDMGGMSPN